MPAAVSISRPSRCRDSICCSTGTAMPSTASVCVWRRAICFGSNGLGIGVHDTLRQRAARRFQDQLGGALARPIANADVGAPLEAVGGFGAQLQLLGGGADVLRLEAGALDQHIHRVEVDFAVLAAHDAGQRHRLGFVGDQQHLAGQGPFLAVQGHELLALGGAADDDSGAGVAGAALASK